MKTRTLATLLTVGAGIGLFLGACSSDETETGGGGGFVPTSSTTSSTTTTTTTTTPSTTTTTSSTTGSTTSSTTSTDTCEDTGDDEPGNSELAGGTMLPAISDADDDPWPTYSGVLDGPSDVDWYWYLGTDAMGVQVVDPEREFNPAVNDARMCVFLWCAGSEPGGPPEIGEAQGGNGPVGSCPDGTTFTEIDLTGTTVGGVALGATHGCCTDPGTASIHLGGPLGLPDWPLSCPDTWVDDTMLVLMRVDAQPSAPATTCAPYTVGYHF